MTKRSLKPISQKRKTRLMRLLCWLWYGHDRTERRFETGPVKNKMATDYKPNKYQYVYCSICGELIGRKLING